MVYKKKISIKKTNMKKYALLTLMAFASAFAFAQDASKSPCDKKFGADSVETQKNLSMFNQYYQEKKYLQAYDYWKYLFDNAPCVQKRVTYAGPFIVKQKIREATKERKPLSTKERAKLKELKAEKVKAAKAANAAAGKPNYAQLKAAYETSVKNYDAYKEEMKASKDAYTAKLNSLAEEVYANHAKRIELHGKEGYVKGKWADDMAKLTPDRRIEAINMFFESVYLEGNSTKYDVPKDFVYAGVKAYKKKNLSMDSLFLILDAVTPIVDYNTGKYRRATIKDVAIGKSSSILKKLLGRPDSTSKETLDGSTVDMQHFKDGYVYLSGGKVIAVKYGEDGEVLKEVAVDDSVSEKDLIEGSNWGRTQDAVINFMKPYLDCEKITELKQPKFEENRANATWLKSTIQLLQRGGCESKEFYLQCSEELYKLVPSSSAAMSLAKGFGKKGDNAKATDYYLKGAELAESDDDKYNIYIKLAKLSKNAKSYAKVRDYARKALAINENSGEAYILIGDAYAASASSCGSGELGRGGVYLVAVDKYVKARNVDPTVSGDSNAKISKYSGYFPDKETAFFKGINNGDSYRVGCWIGESTTVRTTGG